MTQPPQVEAPELLACPCGKLPQLTLGEKDRGFHPSLVTMRLACSGNIDGHIVAGPVVVGKLADTPQSARLMVQAEDAWNAMFARTPDERIAGLVSALDSVWEQARSNHERYSKTGSDEDDIRFLTLGLTGEAGELANFVKKRWRDGIGHDEDIRKEIADVCAYAFMLAQRMGMSSDDLLAVMAEKQQVFVAKMEALATFRETDRG